MGNDEQGEPIFLCDGSQYFDLEAAKSETVAYLAKKVDVTGFVWVAADY